MIGFPEKCISVFLMQACVEQKRSGSSFVGGYLSGSTHILMLAD